MSDWNQRIDRVMLAIAVAMFAVLLGLAVVMWQPV